MRSLSFAACLAIAPTALLAQTATATDTTPKISFGAFVDGYYAWDFDRPAGFDRAYTTQPERHAEFNINLACADVQLDGPQYRGRLSLQAGTSVDELYAGQPQVGGIQYIQEASIGYRLSPQLWIDGGIFASYIGLEGWISRDNLTYTRSMIADNSPYYEGGVKLTWTPSSRLTALFAIVNGWQIISNFNTPPGVGVRLDYGLSPVITLSYDNFLGNAAPDTAVPRVRFFNDVIVQFNPNARWQLAASFDLGLQSRTASANGTATWNGASLIAKYHATQTLAFVGRIERYADPSSAIIQTGLDGRWFTANGGSFGIDVTPVHRLMWRSELRGLFGDKAVFPLHHAGDYSRNDGFVVTSLALTI
jgi:hypothetical protein